MQIAFLCRCLLLALATSSGAIFATQESARADSPPKKAISQEGDLFSRITVHDVRIKLPNAAARSLGRDPHKYVAAEVTIDGQGYRGVQLHLKGAAGSFRPLEDKPGLTLSFSDTKARARFHGLKKFHLNNSVQDPTYLSELICSELFRAAGVPATRVSYAWVEIDERTVGLYTLKESFNDEFLAAYFKNTRGNLYGQSEGGDVTEPLGRVQGDGPSDHSDLKILAAAAQEPDLTRRWERLQQALDINRFISFAAMEVMLCHWDGYTFSQHNYRVFHNLDDGKIVFFPHDMDQMMGDVNTPMLPRANGLISQAVLRTSEGRKLYRERFNQLFTNVFKVEPLIQRIDTVVAQLAPAIRAHDAGMATEFTNNALSLKERIIQRHAALERQRLMPEPKALAFKEKAASLSNWRSRVEAGSLELFQTQHENKSVLEIQSEGEGGVASWRTTVLLEPGRYRFQGRAKSLEVNPRPGARGAGGGLRISGQPRQNELSGTTDWTPLEHVFSVDGDSQEISLVCELRATKGKVWFDLDSLRLEQLP